MRYLERGLPFNDPLDQDSDQNQCQSNAGKFDEIEVPWCKGSHIQLPHDLVIGKQFLSS